MKRYNVGKGGKWKPTPRQELLLRAALAQNEDAVRAWREWRDQTDAEPPDGGSVRMMPLVYLNLTALGVRDPQLEPFRAIYRETWARNHLQMRRNLRAVAALRDAGIPTMLLKASALIPLYYRDPGARPTSDMDVMVPIARDLEALQTLERAGWKPVKRSLGEMSEPYRARHYAHTLRHQDGLYLDLHRHLFYFETQLRADESFWSGSIPLTVEGIETRALNPADQLLHACAHGTPWNEVPPIRWIADAVVLMRSTEIDWGRVVRQAQEHALILTMRNTLGYLRESFGGAIPAETLCALEKLDVTRAERVLYEIVVRPPSEHNTALKLWFHFDQYRRLSRLYQKEKRLLRFPAYLRDTWGLSDTREVPGYIWRFTSHWVTRRLDSAKKSALKDKA